MSTINFENLEYFLKSRLNYLLQYNFFTKLFYVNDIESHEKIKPKISELRVKKVSLHIPTEADILFCLEPALKNNYENVEVDFVDCPDLSLPPFNLASEGICGSPKLAEAGGVPYLIPGPAKYR